MPIETLMEYATYALMGLVAIMLGSVVFSEINAWRSPRKKAYRDGRKAQRDGKGLFDNPYARNTDENALWYSGWKDEREKENGE